MHLKYGELVQLLERLHDLPGGRGVATQSRIKNFSRMDFPHSERVGSGERAEYGAEQIIQLLVGFELLRHRLPPATIAEIVRTEWTRIATTFAGAAKGLSCGFHASAANEPHSLLLVDALALHEVGKTVRPGELLSTIEVLNPDDQLSASATRRSSLIIDPTCILVDVAEQLPWLRRSKDAKDFLRDVERIRDADGDGWAEAGYTRRRALADALAALRETVLRPADDVPPLSPQAATRLLNALPPGGGHLNVVTLGDGVRLGQALLVYFDWLEIPGSASLPKPKAAEVMVIKTMFETPSALHAALVEAICAEAARPVQDH